MAEPDDSWFDPDIASMELDYGEKAGLQIYRNYTRSFEDHAVKKFVEVLNTETLDLDDYRRLAALIADEDARILPVIVCAFADDILKNTFKTVLPESVPGGKANLLSGYGPLSDFSKRIQLAYVFDILSRDIMEELDHLRSVRNKISHSWNIGSIDDFLKNSRLKEMVALEKIISDRAALKVDFSPVDAFRIKLVWIIGRLVYEGSAYNRAKKANLQPVRALYGDTATKWLSEVASIAMKTTRTIAERKQ